MTTSEERRALATDHIDATYSDITQRYYYFAAEVDEWYRVTRRDLELLGRYLQEELDDAYSHWCASSSARIVSRRALRRAGIIE